MTDIVVDDINPRIQYIATSGQTVFTFPFPVFAATDINVYKRAAASSPVDSVNILTYITNYVVAINTAPAVGGFVTLNVGATTGDIVTIVRAMPDQRLNNYVNGGPFTATMVNTDFDSVVMMDQQRQMYDQTLGLHYNVNAIVNYPVVDNIIPVLPAGYIWMKANDDSGIIAVPLPTGGGGGGSVISVGLTSTTLDITGSPITTSGTFTAELPNTGVVSGSYTSADITVDDQGRVTAAANGSGGAGNGSALTENINQAAHGFTVGQIVRFNGSIYVLALADTAANAEVIGMVTTVINANAFTMTTDGLVTGLSGLTIGTNFLSDAVAGSLTAVEPVTPGHINKPVFNAISATSGYFYNFRGYIIPTPTPVAGSWNTVSTATAMASDANYIVNGGAVAFTLPVAADVGDVMRIACYTNSWSLIQGAGQQVRLGNLVTTLGAGGSLASTNTGDCVEFVCTVANTNWVIISSMGNITIV